MRKVEFYEAVARVADTQGEAAGLDEIVDRSLAVIAEIKEKRNPLGNPLARRGSIALGAQLLAPAPASTRKRKRAADTGGKASLKAGQKALAHKIYALIHRMALQCMGSDYAEKYMRARQEEKLIAKMFVEDDSDDETDDESDE